MIPSTRLQAARLPPVEVASNGLDILADLLGEDKRMGVALDSGRQFLDDLRFTEDIESPEGMSEPVEP